MTYPPMLSFSYNGYKTSTVDSYISPSSLIMESLSICLDKTGMLSLKNPFANTTLASSSPNLWKLLATVSLFFCQQKKWDSQYHSLQYWHEIPTSRLQGKECYPSLNLWYEETYHLEVDQRKNHRHMKFDQLLHTRQEQHVQLYLNRRATPQFLQSYSSIRSTSAILCNE